MPGRDRFAQARDSLGGGAAKHGGRGPRVPRPRGDREPGADVGRGSRDRSGRGVEATARALHLASTRLAARMTAAGTAPDEMPAEVSGGFVGRDAGGRGVWAGGG